MRRDKHGTTPLTTPGWRSMCAPAAVKASGQASSMKTDALRQVAPFMNYGNSPAEPPIGLGILARCSRRVNAHHSAPGLAPTWWWPPPVTSGSRITPASTWQISFMRMLTFAA